MYPPTHCYHPELLKGKSALVTGGGTGIGRAIAFELARAGANVTIASRQIEPLQATADAIASETQRSVKTQLVDIRDLDSVNELAKGIASEEGQMDILINNAGGQFPQAAENYSPKGWRTIIDLNLNGTWNMTQALGQQMLNGRGGVILNIIMTIGRGNPG
ncbi:MAG: SDR family NAD(P)-dependent oxidoreductase, partial [Pseudomonadales bacterium]